MLNSIFEEELFKDARSNNAFEARVHDNHECFNFLPDYLY